MLDLSGTWTLADAQGEHRVPMRVPGDVIPAGGTLRATHFPGHDAEIAFTPADGDPSTVRLTPRDLRSSFATP